MHVPLSGRQVLMRRQRRFERIPKPRRGREYLYTRPDDDELIYLTYRGLIFTPEGGNTYLRTTPVFETASDKYGWLNRIITVGVGSVPGKAAYRVFQIL